MAKVLVLSCIDPRFIDHLTNFLNHYKGVKKDYDLFNLAGAELGVIEKKHWRDTFFEHVDLALKLHKIKNIWVFSHLDCGMYKATYDTKKDEDSLLHRVNMDILINNLKKDYPKLKFKKFLMVKEGIIPLNDKIPKEFKKEYDEMMGKTSN
jgi:carbonic anhydrase